MNKWKIVSFYTPSYQRVAKKYLLPSLNRLQLDNYILADVQLDNWYKATSYKATFVKECLNKFDTDIVWVDIDAIINVYPGLFDTIPEEFDIAVHYFDPQKFYTHITPSKPHVASGTVYFRNNEKTKKLVDEWIAIIPKYRLDQASLQFVIENNKEIKLYQLPHEYCYITSQPNGLPPKVILDAPVISHYQASRRYKC